MPKKDRPLVAALRVIVKGADRVSCAGHLWAGESLVPMAAYSAAEIETLRTCDALVVEDAQVTLDAD